MHPMHPAPFSCPPPPPQPPPHTHTHTCSKINLGIGAYGRSWTLADKTKTAIGSAAYAAGPAGKCTGEAASQRPACKPL